jgi:hypothetical protein
MTISVHSLPAATASVSKSSNADARIQVKNSRLIRLHGFAQRKKPEAIASGFCPKQQTKI